jgi:hypothetical protein
MVTGVSSSDPATYFTPMDQVQRSQQPTELKLRPAAVLALHLIQDLAAKQIPVEVQYRFGVDANGGPNLIVYGDEFIKRTAHDQLKKVANTMDDVYSVQQAASELAAALALLTDEVVEKMEELFTEFVLMPHLSDAATFKQQIHSIMINLNSMRKSYRSYERIARTSCGQGDLNHLNVKKEFSSLEVLVAFLANDSSKGLPYLKQPAQWTETRSQCSLQGKVLNIMSAPSRIFVSRELTGVDKLEKIVKELVDKSLAEVLRTTDEHQFDPGDPSGAAVPAPVVVAKDVYPKILLDDANKLVCSLQNKTNLDSMTLQYLELQEKSCSEIVKQIQHQQWRENVVLLPSDKQVLESVQGATNYLTEVIKKKKDAEKLKDIENREISKSISMAKPPTLAKDAQNIEAFLEFHSTFSSANSLHRCLKIREGLPAELKERVAHEVDPDKIINLLKKMFLAEDVLIPVCRQAIVDLKNSPAVGGPVEAKAFSAILTFVTRLQKADMADKLDFSTMALAVSKVSKVNQAIWEKEWYLAQEKLEGTPLRKQEEKKREQFVAFVKLHESLLHRRLLQCSLQGDKEKEKEKPKKEQAFSTDAQLRTTRYDKRTGKDKKEDFDGYKCPLCKKLQGHPKSFPPSKVGTGGKSIARCPDFRNTDQSRKLGLTLKLKCCQRCLSSTHMAESCFLSPTTQWLEHDCTNGRSFAHNPSVCPVKTAQDVSRKTQDDDANNVLISLAEVSEARAAKYGPSINVVCVFDNGSNSNWISEAFASKLPQENRKSVDLNLTTIPAVQKISTFEHSFYIKYKDGYCPVRAYQAAGKIGQYFVDPEVHHQITKFFGVPVEMAQGQVDVLFGLKNFGLHPTLVCDAATMGKNLRLFLSATSHTPKYLVAGQLPPSLSQGMGAPHGKTSSRFTTAELEKYLLQDKGIDNSPVQCPTCRLRSKKCFRCILLTRPISMKEQKEIDLIEKSIKFDKSARKATIIYKPITHESFKEMFPARLSNENQAIAISKRTLRSLKRDGQVKEFEKALQKFIDQGVFEELSRADIEEYDRKDLPSNFISIHAVEKKQSSNKKLSLRIVTNSSLNRTALIGGKEVQASLNSVLPKASPQLNSLVNVTLQWLEKPVSVLIDQERAYHVMKPEDSEEGMIMTHLRRVAWFEDTEVPEDQLKVKFFRIIPVHFGDAPASAALEFFRQKVVTDLRDEGRNTTAAKLASSSFVDDNAGSFDTVHEAFQFYNQAKVAFSHYGAELHEAVISSQDGRFDSEDAQPRTKPGDDEEKHTRIFGWMYDSYKDQLELPLQRNINRKRQGIRVGVDLTEAEVDTLRVTQRSLASFQMSIHDYLGLCSILTIRGKVLLAEVQQRLPPNLKESWDCELPQDLLNGAREYIKMMITQNNPIIKRSPPPGTLSALFVFVDGAEKAFGVAVWGRWATKEGHKQSRFLYAKPKVGRRSIPDQELAAMNLGTEVVKQMLQCLSSINQVHIFGDSSATQHQIKDSHIPRDVYKANRYNSINANIDEIRENVHVNIHLVPSNDNASDPVSKFVDTSPVLLASSAWLEGPLWINYEQERWPTRVSEQLDSTEVSYFTVSSRDARAAAREERRKASQLVPPPAAPGRSLSPPALPDGQPGPAQAEEELQGAGAGQPCFGQPEEGEQGDSASHPGPARGGEAEQGDGAGHAQALPGQYQLHAGDPAPAAIPGAGLFTALLTRVSKVRLGVRVIARVFNIVTKKSFKAVGDQLSNTEEKQAWLMLVSDQNDVNKGDVKGLMAVLQDGVFFTKQRWSTDCHRQLFNCDALPVIHATSYLGELLIKNAHTTISGACRSNDHLKLHLRTSDHPAFLIGNVSKIINRVRTQCVNCRKEKIKIKGGTMSSFSPRMREDRFKDPSLSPFQSFSCDLLGPILVTDRPNAKQTRNSRNPYGKKWILIVVDCSAIRAVKYVLMSSQSAAAFCQALQHCFAETGTVPDRIYTDSGSQLLSVARKESNKFETGNEAGPELDEVRKYMQKSFPNIQFEAAGSSSQYKNGVSEAHIKLTKQYIRNVLALKPNAPLPRFTNEGISLLLVEMALHLNQRPLAWCDSSQTALTASHFTNPKYDDRSWTSEVALADKFINHEAYKQTMRDELVRIMQLATFLPNKWSEEGARARQHDIVLVTRGASKYGQGILEYGKVNSVSRDGRNIQLSVARTGGAAGVVKIIQADARNCHLILREVPSPAPSVPACPPPATACPPAALAPGPPAGDPAPPAGLPPSPSAPLSGHSATHPSSD